MDLTGGGEFRPPEGSKRERERERERDRARVRGFLVCRMRVGGS